MRRHLGSVAMVASIATLVGVSGCAAGSRGARSDGRVAVVAAFAPLAEAASRVGGDRVDVRDLTPPGVEPHDLELTPADMDRILGADLAVVIGGGLQPAVEEAVAHRDGHNIVVLDLPGITSGGSRSGAAGKGESPHDPHVWLDPTRMEIIVEAIADGLTAVDRAGASAYRANAKRFVNDLGRLDREIAAGLADCKTRTMITTHEAFGWMARRYGLDAVGVVGISPEAEPDPKRLAELADLAVREGATTVFTEPLASPKIAETLAREAGGLRTAVLNPLESLSSAQRSAGAGYVSVMLENLATLRAGLGCR